MEYTASTTNATNTITVTAAEEDASIEVKVNGTALNGSTATWTDGTNTVAIQVTTAETARTYTVTVTKN